MDLLKERVKSARLAAGIKSQSELARRCEVDSSAINKLETGDTLSLSGSLLVKLSRVLNVDPDWLTSGSKRPMQQTNGHQDSDAIQMGVSAAEQRLIAGYRAASENLKQAMMRLADEALPHEVVPKVLLKQEREPGVRWTHFNDNQTGMDSVIQTTRFEDSQ